jgi:hypothetical protein
MGRAARFVVVASGLSLAVSIAATPQVEAAGSSARGRLMGRFTATGGGGCNRGSSHRCERSDRLWGVVILTSRSGRVYRIKDSMKRSGRSDLGQGEFSTSVPRGTYRISDTTAGGRCGVYLTGPRFWISNPVTRVTSISITPARSTYVNIACSRH